jgi:hypothetical protein
VTDSWLGPCVPDLGLTLFNMVNAIFSLNFIAWTSCQGLQNFPTDAGGRVL